MQGELPPLGLIAGNGKFPLIFAQEAFKNKRKLIVIALKDEMNEDLSPYARAVRPVSVGKLDAVIQILKEEGVREAVMAGRVQHTKLFLDLIPDWRTAQLLFKIKDRRADSILTAVAEELAKDDITLLPSIMFLEHLLPKPGLLTKRKLSESDEKNIQFGIEIAKGLAGLDVGQTVVVKRRTVVAVEAIEGTDECIRRGGRLGGEGVVVVKCAKPKQDLRFDVPVIGTNTLEVLAESKVKVLAIEAGKTLMLEKEKCIEMADRLEISIAAWEKKE